jgi:twitching motility two-component system response regulator PilH
MTKKPFVLIVEDDEWLADQYKHMLDAAGIKASHVPHALAAINALDTSPPDVLILDVLLPGANAFTLLHELRSHADLVSIPVVLCTSSADQLAREDMAVYGIKTILDKTTMHPEDLVAAVKRALLL